MSEAPKLPIPPNASDFDSTVAWLEWRVSFDSTRPDIALADTNRAIADVLRVKRWHDTRLRDMMEVQTDLIANRTDYYSGKAPTEVYRKAPFNLTLKTTEVQKYVNADENVRRVNKEVRAQDAICSAIEEMLKAASRRGYEIKAVIEWKRLTQLS